MLCEKDSTALQVDGNVFLTDWGGGADGALGYLQVASNARIVGAQVARYLTIHEQIQLAILTCAGCRSVTAV